METSKLRYGLFVCGAAMGLFFFALAAVKYLFRVELSPIIVYYLLLMPPLWFAGRSEYHRLRGEHPANARDAAIVLLMAVLACFVLPYLFQFLLFPNYLPRLAHYFQLSPLAFIIGLMLIRLHASGGGAWLVFAGGFVALAGSFLGVTHLIFKIFGGKTAPLTENLLELFTFVALVLSYLVFLTTQPNGVLKKGVIWLGRIDGELWQSLRYALFPLLIGACHIFGFLRAGYSLQHSLISLTLLLLAGLWVYAGHAFHNMLFYSFAYGEIVLMIFSARFSGIFWSEQAIIWLLLALFILLLPVYHFWLKTHYAESLVSVYCWLIATAMLMFYEHVTFYHATAGFGVMPLFMLWAAALFVPAAITARTSLIFQLFLALLLFTPAILFFLIRGMPSLEYLSNVALMAVILAGVMLFYRSAGFRWLSDEKTREHRLIHHLHWYLNQPRSFKLVFLLATCAAIFVQILSHRAGGETFAGHIVSMLLLQAILAIYWFDRARKERRWLWTLMAEVMLSGVVLTLRLRFQESLGWTPTVDMMLGWFAALTITAIRPLLLRADQSIQRPIRFTLFGLPLITVIYALKYDVTFDALARVILLYSVIFLWEAYSTKERLILAYAFVWLNASLIFLLLYQQVQSLQAYITPVCISILVLVQILRDRTTPATANIVRGAALVILFGTALFQAIVESALSPMAHLIVIFFSVLALTAAVLLRIRIFAAAGLFCFIVDLIAIVYLVLSHQSAETFKILLGLFFTVGGGLILGGFVFYVKHKAQIKALTERMKQSMAAWE